VVECRTCDQEVMGSSKAYIYVCRPGNQCSPLAYYDPTRCRCKQVVPISLLIAFYRLILKFIFTVI